MLRTNKLLLKAGECISGMKYKVVNKETGYYGVALRLTPGSWDTVESREKKNRLKDWSIIREIEKFRGSGRLRCTHGKRTDL